jgi:hypothetical protein
MKKPIEFLGFQTTTQQHKTLTHKNYLGLDTKNTVKTNNQKLG